MWSQEAHESVGEELSSNAAGGGSNEARRKKRVAKQRVMLQERRQAAKQALSAAVAEVDTRLAQTDGLWKAFMPLKTAVDAAKASFADL